MSINLVRFFCYITVQVIFGTWSKGMKQWLLDTATAGCKCFSSHMASNSHLLRFRKARDI